MRSGSVPGRVSTVSPTRTIEAESGSTVRYGCLASPIDSVLVVTEGDALVGVFLDEDGDSPRVEPGWREGGPTVSRVCSQLEEYFAGNRTEFDLEVRPEGTPFQESVWAALLEIPYGDTASYGEIARRVGRPKASRAVGLANGRNPVSIVVPCHRVIGSNGTLTGYGGGLERKAWLLDLEQSTSRGDRLPA